MNFLHYHIRNISRRKGEEAKKYLTAIRYRDQIKRDFCQKEGIELLEIPYWNFNKIEEILVEKLNLVKPTN